ncbi:metallophosphoesterase [Niabella sp. 22666]|uniref:metallophosphoesterase n=1 Tax=Niabella sp. 22666 TaxID=3453954 RepID=UPI003F8517A7
MKKIMYQAWAVLLLTIAFNTLKAQPHKPVLRFGIIADIQYADADTRGTRFYRNSLQKLDSCIQDFNQQKIPFIINLGDITDRDPTDLPPVLNLLNKSKRPVYNTTGNHDYAGVTMNEDLFKKLGMPAEYYTFKKGQWRFILLNTNEVASYANVKGSPKEKELEEMIKKIKAAKGHNAQEYNGGISSRQMDWLRQLLNQAERKKEKVLIFSHHPFACADGLTALNDQEVMSLVSAFSCVKALIAGHHHSGAFCNQLAPPVIVAEGMVETADQNAYGIISLYPDRLELIGHGRMTSRTIHFKNK